ncbi:methyltransferase [bacterium]|nr:methyltransferase [bacterium]
MSIKVTRTTAPALRELREVLQETRYDALQRAMRGAQYYMDPWPNYAALSALCARIPERPATLFRLLLLGDPVPVADANAALGRELVEALSKVGILHRAGKDRLETVNYSLISYQDRYVFTDLPYFYPTCRRKDTRIYIGADSYLLGQNLLSDCQGDVLDLCTGTGFQAIQASSPSNRIVGVELAPEAVGAARCNVVLNGFSERIEILHGNLYEAVGDARFDVIYANPPFLPVPEGVRYPMSGDGGYDGLAVLRRIVEGLPGHLKPGGRAALIAEGVGDDAAPFVARDLARIFKGGRWNVLLLIRGEMPLEYQSYVIAKMTSEVYGEVSCDELCDKWREMYEKQGATRLYSFHLYVERTPRGGRVETVRLSRMGSARDVPRLAPGLEYRPGTPSYFVYRDGRRLGEIDQETREFLELCDGRSSIGAISAQLFPRYAERYRDGGLYRALYEALNTCQTLSAMQVLVAGDGKGEKSRD